MSTWPPKSRLKVETYILRATTVIDLDAFQSHHDDNLVSITRDPEGAAYWWHWQSAKIEPCEGWISLILDNVELMPMSAWTNTAYFWHDVLQVLELYFESGKGSAEFSEEAEGFSLTQKGSVSVFCLRGEHHIVDSDSFIRQLLDSARHFYQWRERFIGGSDPTWDDRIRILGQRLGAGKR